MLPSNQVMEAVERLNFQVSTADVAAQTGLALQVANREVANLASLTDGHLQVSETGEIAYKFVPNFRDVLLQKSAQARRQKFWQGVGNFIFYVVRISFGIVLIVSIILVVLGIIAALIAINSSKNSDNDGDRRDSRGGGSINFLTGYWGNPLMIFYPSYDYRTDQTPPRQRGTEQGQKAQAQKPEGDRGFLENVYSFLFGDGNPNHDLDDRRYRLVANVIRNNDGVVIGEQVLPYLDEISPSALANEDYMLPVLAKFNGFPEVTPNGGLVYRFPDVQVVASRRAKQSVPDYLTEKLWQFNQVGSRANALSAGLGIFYLGASVVLGILLGEPVVSANLSGLLGLINGIFWFLLVYAILFLTIPTVRYFVLQMWNAPIKSRNLLRQERSSQLSEIGSEVKEKLAFARKLAISQSAINEQKLAYSTESELIFQELEQLLEGE